LRLADPGTGAQVHWDVTARPLPEIPLPNDVATVYDPTSPTGLRINASQVATTQWETSVRKELDKLDGWGTFAPITAAFDAPLDVEPIYTRMQGNDDLSDDPVYLIDISPDSPDFCQAVPLDMGRGNFPLYLQQPTYFPNDPRNQTNQLIFEEVEEDAARTGQLLPGEDTDMDGVLDHPNVRAPGGDVVNDLVTFYERQTRTLILRPVMPLREETTYAVVLTRDLVDTSGRPVRSPFRYINHAQQTAALAPLAGCLQGFGRTLDDVAFTWSFTTQSISRDFVAIRDGLRGIGSLGWLGDAQHYPAELSQIFDLQENVLGGPVIANYKIVTEEQVDQVLNEVLPLLISGDASTIAAIMESRKFVGYHVVGQFISPQFFPRAPDGADGSNAKNWLPLYDQVWKVDPTSGRECSSESDTECTWTRPEVVTFWLTVPKPEYAAAPAPVVMIGHGYGDSKLDALAINGYFARHGMATIAIDCVSHGLGLDSITQQLVEGAFDHYHLEPMAKALLNDRAFDQNGDGVKDPGADFWTAYTFHTRDMVRQSAVDYLRMVQIIQSFDGTHRWKFDVNHDGTPELAGDFNADGTIDIGGSAPIYMFGVSLGGIMSSTVAGLEPAVPAVVSVSGGAGLMDVGVRSSQAGVVAAVNLRVMGPLVLTLPTSNGVGLWEYVPDLNKNGQLQIGTLQDPLNAGDTAVLRNLRSGEWGCARVQSGQLLRATVKADQGDPLQLEIYPGPLPPSDSGGCDPSGATARTMTSTLGAAVSFQGATFPAGSPLIAFGDGFGEKRGTPDLRRLMEIAQISLDPADPANFAPNYENRLLTYGTGESVRTRSIVVTSIGDPTVPIATGAALARAAGFIDAATNQTLIDTYAIEGATRAGRHINASGDSVLEDVEHLSAVSPNGDGWDVPRLDPPLHRIAPSMRVGGVTGALFPMSNPHGMHVFAAPDPTQPFDVGTFLVNAFSHYLHSGGTEFSYDGCQIDSSCAWIPPVPQ
jgi:hypothetical protein